MFKASIHAIAFGRRGEEFAARHLKRCGYRILSRNFRTKFGEIDVVAARDRQLIFVEVRSRSSTKKVSAQESITPRKISRIKAAAELYLARMRLTHMDYRFDVITVTPARNRLRRYSVEHLKNCFDFSGRGSAN